MGRFSILFIFATQAAFASISTEKFEFEAKDIKSTLIHNSTGNIHVAPSESKMAYVIVNKIKWGPRCSAKVEVKGGQLHIETDDSAWILDHECRVDLVVSLPKQIPLQVRAGTGDIKILASRGDVDVKVGSGLISLKGEIASLKALSGSGDVKLEGLAQTADIKTGSGDIELDYQGAPKTGKLSVQTGTGDVEVYFPENSSIKSQISTGNGSVLNEFESSNASDLIQVSAASAAGNIQIRKK